MKSDDRIAGDLPFVTAGETNEGISDFISNATITFPTNTTTIDMFGSAKYRNYQYGGDDHIAVVHTENLPKFASIFITSAIHKAAHTGKFDYGRNFYAKDADELNIQLPIKNGQPDYAFMDNFIATLEAERIAELKTYLQATGLKDTILTAKEENAIKAIEIAEWKNFNVVDIFNIRNTKNILSREIVENSGATPYLCASAENNAVSSYISFNEEYLEKGNCIFIGGKTFVVTYQNDDFYSNDSHNLVLYSKNKAAEKSKKTQLFLVTCTTKSLNHQYSWGDSISNRKIQTDRVLLPIKNGQPDYAFMELIISAIQKLVIKDVVNYVDKNSVHVK